MITYELLPHIEKTFRGLGQPWSRFMYGGSTGGWEAMGAQIMYPDQYNGALCRLPGSDRLPGVYGRRHL